MKFDDENMNILFSNRAFCDVLEGVTSKDYSWAKPPHPNLMTANYERLNRHIVFDPLAKVLDMQEVFVFSFYINTILFSCLQACLVTVNFCSDR